MRKLIRAMGMGVALVCLLLSTMTAARAASAAPQAIRVGYYEDGDYMRRDGNGEYAGFNFEYLQEITKYTGWECEVVDGVSWENTFEMLKSGEIDLLPAVFRTEERDGDILFSDQPICNIFVTLNVRVDDMRYDYENFEAFQGMKIGVIRGGQDAESFADYCRQNAIQVDIRPYAETDALLNALADGTLDGVAITHLGRNSTFRSVAQFSPQPLYFALSPRRADLLPALNAALNTMKLRDPTYDAKMYEKYFSVSASQKPVFTKEELDYIREAGVVSTVYDSTRAPLSFRDPQTGLFSGVAADLFKEISATTGLTFEFDPVNGFSEALERINDPAVDIICSMTSNYLWNNKYSLNTTQSYLRAPVVLVTDDRAGSPSVIAMPRGYLLSQHIAEDNPDKRIVSYDSPEECFEALLRGEADITYVNTHIADYLLSDPRYIDFTATTLTNYTESISIAVSKHADPLLFSILDKCIQYTAKEQMDDMLLRNSILPYTITWQDIIRLHPLAIIGGVSGFFLVVILLLCVLLYNKSQSSKKIERLLYRDSLTGLWNLNKFQLEVQKYIEQPQAAPCALIYTDIKQFRIINDTLGFGEGDGLLCAIAEILRGSMAEGEFCARVSADQFVMLLRCDDKLELIARIKDFDRRINEWTRARESGYHLVMVFGVYLVDQNEERDVSRMLDYAGSARRSAAVSHRSVIVLYDAELRRKELRQRDFVDRMDQALLDGEFVPYFQPKVDMRTGELIGSEALVRWMFPNKGMINPGEFIPIFERNGFIAEIDLYIFEQVCKALRQWLDRGWKVWPVSCNFSRRHFLDMQFVQRLVEVAGRYQIPHGFLELEVTESVFFENVDQVLGQFDDLKNKGFLISIDDFGSGYSSLGLLQRFSVDIIKLDRSFIELGMRGERGRAVIGGVLQMASQLEMQVICEGVETQEQARMLMDLGCFAAQGFLYARPMPQEEFEERLRAAQKSAL